MFTVRDYRLAKLAYDTFKQNTWDTLVKWENLGQDARDKWARVVVALQNKIAEEHNLIMQKINAPD